MKINDTRTIAVLASLFAIGIAGCAAVPPSSAPAELIVTDGIVDKSGKSPKGVVRTDEPGIKCETVRRAGSNMKKRLCTTEKEEAYKLRRTQYNFVKTTRRW